MHVQCLVSTMVIQYCKGHILILIKNINDVTLIKKNERKTPYSYRQIFFLEISSLQQSL